MDDNPDHLRERAVRLLATAIQLRETEPGYADKLIAEAIGLHERATAMEDAANIPSPSETRQAPAQLQEQIQSEKNGEDKSTGRAGGVSIAWRSRFLPAWSRSDGHA